MVFSREVDLPLPMLNSEWQSYGSCSLYRLALCLHACLSVSHHTMLVRLVLRTMCVL
jgi:hypothetical protein